jgi:hypothetical protein
MDTSTRYYLVVAFALTLVALFVFLTWKMTWARRVVAKAIGSPLSEVPLPFWGTRISEGQEKLFREAVSNSAGKYVSVSVTYSTVHHDHDFERYQATEKALDEAEYEFKELIDVSRWYRLRLSGNPLAYAPFEQSAA